MISPFLCMPLLQSVSLEDDPWIFGAEPTEPSDPTVHGPTEQRPPRWTFGGTRRCSLLQNHGMSRCAYTGAQTVDSEFVCAPHPNQ